MSHVGLLAVRRRNGRARLATVIAATLVASLGVPVQPATAAPPEAAAAVPAVACPASKPDEAAAHAAAVQCTGRVEIESARTEKGQLFANADGSRTSVEAAYVQRVRREAGGWAEPDPTLRRTPDGGYAPVASALDMRFSAGGTGALVTVRRDRAKLSLSWPGRLPAPKVADDTLTYPEVLPGVDLVVTAGVEGFTEVLVVKSAKAAANPALARVRFRTQTSGLRLQPGNGGSLAALDDKGAMVFGSGTPTMWDASGDIVEPVTGAGTRAKVAPMPMRVADGEISVQPDRGLLVGKSTKYPVYIDPAIARTSWTMINNRYPNQSYWSYDRKDCPSRHQGKECAKVGYTDEGATMTYRSLFQFATARYIGKHVIDAKLSMDLLHSWSCTNSRTDVHVSKAILGAGTDWNNNAKTWGGVAASVSNSSCAQARRRTEWNLTTVARTAAEERATSRTLGLKAQNEGNHNGWKKFDAGTASLAVTYNSYPNAPGGLTIDNRACATGANRPYVKVLTPQLRARLSDPDGHTSRQLTGTFWWWPLGAKPSDTNRVAQSNVAHNTDAVVSIPDRRLVDGTTYAVRAQAHDGTDKGQFSATCEFTLDVTPPGTPAAVSSPAYPADGQLHGGAGVLGTFAFSPPTVNGSDLAGYAYTLDTGRQAAQATQINMAADRTATVSFTPPTDGVHTLRVWARDKAGNFSAAPREYRFGVRAGAGPDAMWHFDEGSGATVADASRHGNPLTLDGATWTAGRGAGKALSPASTGFAATAGPIATKVPATNAATTVRTDANFTVSAWVRLGAVGGSTQRVVIGQDGSRTSAYTLGYSGPDNKWRFAMAGADTDAPAAAAVLSDAVAKAGVWTHLAATYETTGRRLKLYVNGVAQAGTATLSGGFNATGPVTVGRARWAGAGAAHFNGAIDDVRVYARTLSPTEAEFTRALVPPSPSISFPAGSRVEFGKSIDVTLDANGDADTTRIRYGVDVQTMPSTAVLPAPGGRSTVSVKPTRAGETFLFAAAVTGAGRQSDTVAEIIDVALPPSLGGTVSDLLTGAALPGVTVHLDPGDRTVTTGANGTFSFTGITAGTYTVSAAASGACGSIGTTEVTVDGPAVTDLLLAPQRDRFGYTCSVSDQAFVPADDTVLKMDHYSGGAWVNMPFEVPFYGKKYGRAWVAQNGTVRFNGPSEFDEGKAPIPNAGPSSGLVAPFWEHLWMEEQSSVRTATVGTAPNRRFVVEWRDLKLPWPTGPFVTFEAIFEEGTGDIVFNYAGLETEMERGSEVGVGIENVGGGVGSRYSFDEPVLADGRAITFHYPEDPEPSVPVTISGTLREGDRPVAGAEVKLFDSGHRPVRTDADGRYSFTDVEPGGYVVTAEQGCRRSGGRVDAAEDATFDLKVGDFATGIYTCHTESQAFQPAQQSDLEWSSCGKARATMPFELLWGMDMRTPHLVVASDGWVQLGEFNHPCDASWGHIRPYDTEQFGPNRGSTVHTEVVGTAPNRKFVIEWRNLAHREDASREVTYQAIIGEDHSITFNYSGIDGDLESRPTGYIGLRGMRDGDVDYSAHRPVLADGQAIVFRHQYAVQPEQ